MQVGDFAVDKGMRSVVVFDAMGNPEGAFCPLPRCTLLPRFTLSFAGLCYHRTTVESVKC